MANSRRPAIMRAKGRCSFLDGQKATVECSVRFYNGHSAIYEYCPTHADRVAATNKGDNVAERFFVFHIDGFREPGARP